VRRAAQLANPRTQLKIAFLALGVLLLASVLILLHSALSRLDEQRNLRQRMVAERVFDEVEREIGTVLQHEAERPSAAYDAVDRRDASQERDATDPSRWSRFVAGYYRRDPLLQLVAEASLSRERAEALRELLERVEPELVAARANIEEERVRGGDDSTNPLDPQPSTSTPGSPDVLRRLNRGVKVRERRMHDFVASFAIVRAGQFIIAERESLTVERREGLVIDVPALVDWTQAWVLGSQGLDQLAVLKLSSEKVAADPGSYEFRHRLAAPFEAYEASLHLARLGDEDARSTLYGITALFAFAASLGLFAIFRMVEVQLAFAERRNNFVAAVTHELRTPLTSIRMYGEMLRDGMVTDEETKQEYYATITAEGERLTRLINNVMEHGKLRRGQRHAHLTRGDAAAVVREVLELMRPHIEREGFSVRLTAAGGLPEVSLDEDALKQMLFNVIDNALKYGRGDGPAKIDVTCAADPSGGVVVSVRDYGRGVSEAQLQAVFEPFFRGESELTRRQQGTGLGLALVRDLVALMRGSVQGCNRTPGFEVRISLRAA
jgi:signal transduction histidine kinase